MRASVDNTGAPAGDGGPGILSADGTLVAFYSATKLAGNDTNTRTDTYVHELGGVSTPTYSFTLKPAALNVGDATVKLRRGDQTETVTVTLPE